MEYKWVMLLVHFRDLKWKIQWDHKLELMYVPLLEFQFLGVLVKLRYWMRDCPEQLGTFIGPEGGP